MCGRVALFSPPSYFARFLEAALAADLDPDGRASWNVGPQRSLFAVAEHDEARVLDRYRWGLVPSWAKDPSIGNKLFNARGETVAEKPSFRTAFAKRRDEQPLLFAGLFENWWNREDEAAPPLATCTIITTTPNDDVDGIHDRMPVVLSPEDVEVWLNVAEHEPEERVALLRPAPKGTLTYYGVSKAVGSVKNDGPELTEPVEPQSLF
jgi:putative SOS response-associated peptidase YedK